jgi:hypothetical protein
MYTGKRKVDIKNIVEKGSFHQLVGPVTLIVTLAMFLLIAILVMSGCTLSFRFPDKNHPACQVPYAKRPACYSHSDCAQDYLCAFRGDFYSIEGRCTYIDCCDPWRNRRLEGGRSFCDTDINPDIPNRRKPVRNEP